LAIEKWFPLFDPQQGNKEQADIVVDLLGVSLIQSASRAAPRRMIQGSRLGLNAGNKKTHTVPLVANDEFIL
jgi:hypothetical protein